MSALTYRIHRDRLDAAYPGEVARMVEDARDELTADLIAEGVNPAEVVTVFEHDPITGDLLVRAWIEPDGAEPGPVGPWVVCGIAGAAVALWGAMLWQVLL